MGILNLAARGDRSAKGVLYLVADGGANRSVGHFCVHRHLAIHLRRHREVREVRVGYGAERYVAEDSHCRPVVEAVELIALEAAVDAHGQLLLLALESPLRKVGREVEVAGVVGRLPCAYVHAVEPQVIAAQHTVQAQHHVLPSPCSWDGERCAVVARQRVGIVVPGLTESVCLPTARHRDGAP